MRTLDPWVTLGTCAAVTSRIGLSTAVALPVESDPITLAKTLATLDFLSGGRVTLGVGFGWNTDELTDHHVPADRRRTVLKEYLEAMRACGRRRRRRTTRVRELRTSWAYPKPPQGRIPVIVGAELGPQTARWIAKNADGWMSTPRSDGIGDKVKSLQVAWEEAGREGKPEIKVLVAKKPTPETSSSGPSPTS